MNFSFLFKVFGFSTKKDDKLILVKVITIGLIQIHTGVFSWYVYTGLKILNKFQNTIQFT